MLTAPPERLVVMLYDGAIRFLHQAAAAHRAGERSRAHDRVRRGQAIIDELNRSLDLGQGDVAHGLRSIYQFCTRHLIDSTAQSDPGGYEQVAGLLADLRESWAELANA